MSNDVTSISANTPVLEGQDELDSRFSRGWYNFFALVLKKIRMLDGSVVNSATAGTASNLPAKPAGYMIINDLNGTPCKVPFYN